MSLNVSLPPDLESRIRQQVESRLYSSASEVIREALHFFEAYQGVQAARLTSVKAASNQSRRSASFRKTASLRSAREVR